MKQRNHETSKGNLPPTGKTTPSSSFDAESPTRSANLRARRGEVHFGQRSGSASEWQTGGVEVGGIKAGREDSPEKQKGKTSIPLVSKLPQMRSGQRRDKSGGTRARGNAWLSTLVPQPSALTSTATAARRRRSRGCRTSQGRDVPFREPATKAAGYAARS